MALRIVSFWVFALYGIFVGLKQLFKMRRAVIWNN